MDAATFALNFFIALFALIDPVGSVPLYAAATTGATPAQSRLTAVYMASFAFVFLGFFFLTLPAFRIAGGVVLLLMGLDMVRGEIDKNFSDDGPADRPLSVRDYAAKRFERLVVPFGMPLLVGPGAISTVVIYAEEARRLGASGVALGLAALLAVSITIVLSFWFTSQISRAMGRVGMVIVVRVLGLILTAMAVQFILTGWAASTTGSVRHEVAQPYQASHPSR